MTSNFYTLITGASEGFGRSLALECARRKMNLILVALPGEALRSLTECIKANYAVDVLAIEKDLCDDDGCYEVYQRVVEIELQVNVLINNAGVGTTGLFGDASTSEYEQQIKLNVLVTTVLTRLFLGMLKNNSPSHILNVGSMASFFPLPKKQVYGATKSFIYYFSQSLRAELRKDKVFVSLVCPGVMKTNKTVTAIIERSPYLLRHSCMEPERLAPVVIKNMMAGKRRIIAGKLNIGYLMLYTLLPAFVQQIITDRTMKKLSSHNGPVAFSQGQLALEVQEIDGSR